MSVADELRSLRQNASIFKGLFNFIRENEQELASRNRRPVMGGLFSKEPVYGADTIEYEGIKPFLANLVEPVARAIDAPQAAAQGLIPKEDMTGEAFNVAGTAMFGGGLVPGIDDAVIAANRAKFGGLLNPLIDDEVKRVNKIELDPAMLSEQKLPTFVERIPFTTEKSPDEMMPVIERDISEFKGSLLTPAYGDRTYGGEVLTHIGDVKLTQPVDMQGGHDFMRYMRSGLWASEKSAMEKKAKFYDKLIEEGADPLMIYTAMGGQSADFSHHMSDAMMGLIEQSPISKKAAKKFDDFVKNVGNKYDKKLTPGDKNWPGIMNPDARRYLLENMTGTNRRLLWQEMDKKSYLEDGFPFVGAVRAAITDPSLQRTPYFATGQSIGRARGGGLLSMDDAKYGNYGGVMPHKSYDSQIEGDYLGKLIENVPAELIFRDFFNARRNAGIATSGDQRSFMMSPYVAQRVDNQMIDDVSQYLENLRRGY